MIVTLPSVVTNRRRHIHPPSPIKGLHKEKFRVIGTNDLFETRFIFNGEQKCS